VGESVARELGNEFTPAACPYCPFEAVAIKRACLSRYVRMFLVLNVLQTVHD